MSGEGEDNVEKITPNAEGKITADKDGKYPEVVPWPKYVGIKESLGGKLDAERTKVASLEEKLKETVSKEEHDKIKAELEEAKTKEKASSDELTGLKDKSLTEKRDVLVKRGVSVEKLTNMSAEQIDALIEAAGTIKPGADMGGGGGAESPGKAKDKIRSGFDSLHP